MSDVRFHNLYLEIVTVGGYERKDVDGNLRHSWINPSPNIPSLETALVYPGMVFFFEGIKYSVGRGTTRPFVYSGAPWLNSQRTVKKLQAHGFPGTDITAIRFEPMASHYQGKLNQGVMIVPKSLRFDPLRVGYEYMRIVKRLHRRHFRFVRSKDRRFFMISSGAVLATGALL